MATSCELALPLQELGLCWHLWVQLLQEFVSSLCYSSPKGQPTAELPTSLCQCGTLGIYFLLWIVIQDHVIYLLLELFQLWSLGIPSGLFLCPSDMLPSLLFCFVLFLSIPCFQLLLGVGSLSGLLPGLDWESALLWRPGVFSLESCIRN